MHISYSTLKCEGKNYFDAQRNIVNINLKKNLYFMYYWIHDNIIAILKNVIAQVLAQFLVLTFQNISNERI